MMECSPEMARIMGDMALKEAANFDKYSRLTNVHPDRAIAQLEPSDVNVGNLLGTGAFSAVYQVSSPQLGSSTVSNDKPLSVKRRGNKINNHSREYAIKVTRMRKDADKHHFQVSARCMVVEAKLLANMNHDNIIKLYGVKAGCIAKSVQEGGYFLVLERVYGTLDQRLGKWQKLSKKNSVVRMLKKQYLPTVSERIQSVALGVARAMEYLHSHNVLYRDLKPQNIGFDAKGQVILFDFGVAQELDPGHDSTTCKGGRKLTQRVGTYRYMAPETFSSTEYGLPSDVYSFSLLLWAIATLEIPFKEYSSKKLKSGVVGSSERPSLKEPCLARSPKLVQLIEECWDASPKRRPTFSEICKRLQTFVPSGIATKCRQ